MIETLAAMAKGFAETKLADLAKDVLNDKLDMKELDKPLSLNNERDSINPKELTDEKFNEERKELAEVEKDQIKSEMGWSDEIINSIKSMDQYEIYKNAGLEEAEIDGRKCLIKEIDLDFVDEKTGMTNSERMEKGLSPIDAKTGEKIELHHMGQAYDSPLVELTENSEHGGKNHSVLHDNGVESWRRIPELKNQYQNHDKPNHWKERTNAGGEI